jgi:hypothetical protein
VESLKERCLQDSTAGDSDNGYVGAMLARLLSMLQPTPRLEHSFDLPHPWPLTVSPRAVASSHRSCVCRPLTRPKTLSSQASNSDFKK